MQNANKNFPKISDIISLPFTLFPCKVNSPQVKCNLKCSITNFMCDLPQELPNDVRLMILGNQERKIKSQNWLETQGGLDSPSRN